LVNVYEQVISDSVKTGRSQPSTLYQLTLDQIDPSCNFCSTHGIDIMMAFEVGCKLDYELPAKISIYGIEVEDNINFDENCMKKVEQSTSQIVREIIERENLL